MNGAGAVATWCDHYDAGRCRSCTLLPEPYDVQLRAKVEHAGSALPDLGWLPPVTSRVRGFRNKAKMVVAGTVEHPTLGILDGHGHGVDLRDCGLYEPALTRALPVLAAFVRRAHLVPYDVPTRRGELKHLVVTGSPEGELMVRFVLRSTEALARIRKHLPWLSSALPALRVASVNVQPAHAAVLEGDREVVLLGETLPMRVNHLTLHLRPQSFFQTNTAVAAALYRTAAAWAADLAPASVLDLFCGVGGFALHLGGAGRSVHGVEVAAEAVASARRSAAEEGIRATFAVGDATTQHGPAPELLVVNPPRRGLGAGLSRWIEESGVAHLLYSSCNVDSLARDLALMPSMRPVRGVLLDMFPHTRHHEVLLQVTRS